MKCLFISLSLRICGYPDAYDRACYWLCESESESEGEGNEVGGGAKNIKESNDKNQFVNHYRKC